MTPIDGGGAGPGDEHGERFRAAVDTDRAAVEARARSLRSEFDGIVAASVDANADDEHDPEGATVAFERARTAALLADAKAHLSALDRAEDRLAAGTYARCEQCGGSIAEDRLTARPAVVTCIRCATIAAAVTSPTRSSRSSHPLQGRLPPPPRP